MATARCTKCGSENPKEALFCTACGQALHHEQNDPLVGQTIGGRYHLVERIGQGAAGTIYRAEHTTLRRRMAVKLLHQQLAQNEDAVERFRREAITVCEIDNDHIPQVFDFGRAEDGRLFFAMEFLDGVPLSMVLEREGRLTPERVADVLSQIGDGLMEAHTLGYIHRDLRPRSIFLTRRRGRADFVKILDFGLAKLVQPELTDAQRTAMGMTYGDPRYMAPEQARGEVVDRRADIYSLGVLGYEMICGEQPFKGTGTFDILSKLLEAPVPRLRDKRPDCPPWLESVIRTALAKKPSDRFQTVAQFLDAMERKNVLANQPPLPMQVAPGAKADAVKKLTPMSAPDSASSKGQEVRAFVSYPAMKSITVPVDDQPRPVAQGTQSMPTVAPGTQLAALAAAVEAIEPPQHQQPQSIKKTLAYPAIRTGQRSEPAVSPPSAAPPPAAAPSTAIASPVQVQPKPEATKQVAPSATARPEATASSGPKPPAAKPETPAQPLKSGFVNIVATRLDRGDPTPRTARAMLEQESLAWEEAALPALLTHEVDLTESATSADLTRLPPSADTPVEQMNFDPHTASPQTPVRREPSAPTAAKAAVPREPIAKEVSAPSAQRDSSRIAAMSTPAPQLNRTPSGPATKQSESPRPATPVVTPSPSIEIPRAKATSSSAELGPLSTPSIGRPTKPGMGPLSPEAPPPAAPVLEPAPAKVATSVPAAAPSPDEDAPNEDETIRVLKAETVDGSSTETLKQNKVSPAELAHGETTKVVKVDADEAKPTAESERTPESPPPEMGGEGDAGWFAQSTPATAAMLDDDDALSLKKKTPRWVVPAAVSAVAVIGLLLYSQGGSHKGPETVPSVAPSTSPSTPPLEPSPKVEAATSPTSATGAQGTTPPVVAEPLAAQPVSAQPVMKPEPTALPPTKPEESAKSVPKAEPLPAKAEPKPSVAKSEPEASVAKAEPKPEPKPSVAKSEPKPEPKPAVAKPEPKPEPKPAVAKSEPKPEPKPAVAKPEPKPEPKPAVAKSEPKPEPKPVAAEPGASKPSGELLALVSLGKQKLDDGDVDAAVASFRRAVQLDGKNADAVAGLGEANFEQGNFDGAARNLAQAAKLAPRKVSYQELLAQAQFKLGRYKDAAETCRKILKDHPGSTRAKQTLEQAEKKLDDM